MTSPLTQARRGFEAAFGYPPGGIWSAPGRVNLIGEHTRASYCPSRSTAAPSAAVDLKLGESGLAVLVIDTRVRHQHVSGGYASRRAACEKAARALGTRALRDVTVPRLLAARGLLDEETYRRARHVVTENQRVLDTVEALRIDGPAAVGGLMLASHRSMREDFEISTPALDLAVATAMDNGATGARMTGGGFGGSAIALAPAAMMPRLRDAVGRAFSERGHRMPGVFAVRPSHGAQRET